MVAAMKVLLRKRGEAAVGHLGLRDGFRINGCLGVECSVWRGSCLGGDDNSMKMKSQLYSVQAVFCSGKLSRV